MPNAYNVWHHASEAQIDRWLRPALKGDVRDAYAVTERDAGSDPSRIATTAEPTADGFRINGEKWFVTTGDMSQVLIVMANVIDGGEKLPTLFVIPNDAPGVEIIDNPDFTHSYPDGHPTILFTDVEVTAEDAIGGIGGGNDLQRSWFMEERLGIATRCVGAMWRLLDETVKWAASREQGGSRILDYQGVSFPLADSAADATAGRLLTLTVAEMADRRRRPEARSRQGLDGEALHQRGRLALRRPLRAGLRRTRLPALQRRRAVPARAACRSHLGGDERDPAPRRRPWARAPRRRANAALRT